MTRYTLYRVIVIGLCMITFGNAGLAQAQDDSVTCPGFLPSRLEIGGMGRALPGVQPEIFFADEAAPTASATDLMADDVVFTVLDGPECLDNTAWWQIDYDGSTVWTMEGMGEEYWVVPAPELDQTYMSGGVTFDYPGDWEVLSDQDGTVLVGAPGTTGIGPGTFLIAVFTDAHLVPSLSSAAGTPTELLEIDAAAGAGQGVEYGTPVTVEIDGREVAHTYSVSETLGMDSMIFVVDLGDGTTAYLASITAPGEVALSQPAAVAIAYSLAPAGAEPIASGETAVYVSEDGAFTFEYPADWIAEPLDSSGVGLINDESVYSISDLDSFGPDQLFAIVYPTLADTGDYPMDTVDANTVASTVVSYYASMGMVSGYTQEGAMEMFTFGEREVSSSLAHAATHDRLVIAADNGQGDFVVIIAAAAPGELESFKDALLEVAASVNQP
jgi:hypothetical protein